MKNRDIFTPFLILTGLLALAFACSDKEDQGNPYSGEEYSLIMEYYTFYANGEKYAEANARRAENDFCQLDFQIQRVQRSGNELSIHILRPEGCEIDYEILWDGAIMESFPMGANIFIRALGEECDGDRETEMVVVDLEKTFKNMTPWELENTQFFVKDACSLNDFQCAEDCDVSVSSN